MTTFDSSILAELDRIKGHHDQLDSLVERAETRRNRVKTRLAFARSAIREAIDGTAARLGVSRLDIALCDGERVAVVAIDGEVILYRVSMIGPGQADAINPARDLADAIGHAAYACGCTPAEAGVPCCDGGDDCQDFEFSPDDVLTLGPLTDPIVGHPLAAHAVADMADDEGQVPAHAVASMQMAAMSQGFGVMDNEIG